MGRDDDFVLGKRGCNVGVDIKRSIDYSSFEYSSTCNVMVRLL